MSSYPASSPWSDRFELETAIDLSGLGDRYHPESLIVITGIRILLLAGEGKKDEDIMATLHTSRSTVIRTRRRFVFGGLKFALEERSRAGRFPKVTAKVEAVLMTLAQSQPPEGQHRWTLQLLTDRLVTLTKLESLSTEAVRLTLKNTTSNRGSGKNGASRRSSALNL